MSYYFKLVYKIKENNGGKNEFTRIFDGDFGIKLTNLR